MNELGIFQMHVVLTVVENMGLVTTIKKYIWELLQHIGSHEYSFDNL